MGETVRMVVVLVVIALFSGLAVGITNNKTADRIRQIRTASRTAAVQAVLPADAAIEERRGDNGLPEQYWVAVRDSETVAYAFPASARGYSSDIKVVAGVDTSGVILGVSVLEQKETPGLGTRVAEVVSKRYIWGGFGGTEEKAEPWFTEQFEGLDLDERIEIDKSGEWHTLDEAARMRLEERNTVSAISGATISTRAVRTALETTVYPYIRELRERN